MTSHVQKPIGWPAIDATMTRCPRRVGRLALVFVLAALAGFGPIEHQLELSSDI
jgi:hypothetical protein